MDINKETLNEFRRDLAKALKDVEEKYLIDLNLGSISYELNSFHATLTARKRGLDRAEWDWYSESYGLEKEDLGKMFKYNQHFYSIVGINRGSKYPIKTQRDDGKSYDFTADLVKTNLK